MNVIVPNLEEDIPLPSSAMEALPELTPQQEIEMRAKTIKLISDLNHEPIEPTPEHMDVARQLARQMIENPAHRPEFAKYPNEVMAYLAGMVAQSNCMIVEELSDLKLYVVNKLVAEIENAKDPKARIAALSKLGEVDGVDAFKKRSEMTVKIQSIEEVEKELIETLNMLEDQVVDVEVREIGQGLGANNGA
jgi:undecaprenyl pyrophosphate synthase